MRVKLNGEDGFKAIDDGVGAQASAPLSARASAKAQILDTISAAMAGTLDKPADLQPYFVDKFNETHVMMVLERATTSQTVEEIAAKYDYSPQQTYLICAHPYAKRIIAQVMGAAADRVEDVMDRFAQVAAEAAEVKIAIMRSSKNDGLRDKIASDILDRAGYGARRQVEVSTKSEHTVTFETRELSQLTNVLAEANRVAVVDYRQHLAPKPAKRQGSEQDDSDGVELLLEGGHPQSNTTAGGAVSPTDSPVRQRLAALADDDDREVA